MAKRKRLSNENWSHYKINKFTKLANTYYADGTFKGSKIGQEEYIELLKYNRQLVRLSNKRLRALKKAGKDYYAYDSAQNFTESAFGTTRYKENITNPNTIKLQILSMQRFLNMKTSTVQGHLAVEENRRNKFREMFPEIESTNDELDGFLRFLGEAPQRSTIFEAGKMMSGGLVDLIRGRYMESNAEQRDEIREMFKRYRETMSRTGLGQSWREYDLGYDELVEYLKTGIDPTKPKE